MSRLVLALFFLLSFAACSQKKISISESVIINASIHEVWNYNANDDHAKDWSIFFAKIVPCPPESCPENTKYKPGEIGATRRCYRNSDESGIVWDEKTLDSKLDANTAYRKILAYNFNGYKMKALRDKAEYVVEQFYKQVSPYQTELTFSVRLQDFSKLKVNMDPDSTNNTSYMDRILITQLFYFGADRTREIFNKNLFSIKLAIENKDNYKRKYSYSKFCDPKSFFCPKFMVDY